MKVGTDQEAHQCVSGQSENKLPWYTVCNLLDILKDPNNKKDYEQMLKEEAQGELHVANFLRNGIAQNLTLEDWVNVTEYTYGLGYATYIQRVIIDSVFSKEFSFHAHIFKDDEIDKTKNFISLSAFLTNIKLSQLNLGRLLQTERAAKHRLLALLQGPSLKSLDLSDNDLGEDFVEDLQKLSRLTKLNVQNNVFDSLNLERFPNLTTLNASSNVLKDLLLQQPENPITNLTTLNVARNSISTYYFRHFIALTELDMSYCNIRKVDDLSSLTNLRNLNVEGNNLGEKRRGMYLDFVRREPGKNMSILATLPNLTCLNLAHNGVKNEDMVALDPLVKKGTTTICFKKRDSRNPNIIGPHPELFHIGTQ